MNISVRLVILLFTLLSLNVSWAENTCNCQAQFDDITQFGDENTAIKKLIGSTESFGDTKTELKCIKKIRRMLSKRSEIIKQCKVIKYKAGCANFYLMGYDYKCSDQRAKEATLFFSSVVKGTEYLDKQVPLEAALSGNCEELEEKSTQQITIQEKEKVDKLRLKFTSLDFIKDKLLPFVPGRVLDRSKDKFGVKLFLPNDNKGLGLLDDYLGEGDDYGNTHGYLLEISKGIGNDFHVTISLSSNLYTERIAYDEAGDLKKYRNLKKMTRVELVLGQ